MFGRKNSSNPKDPRLLQPEDYDNLCINVDGIEEMTVEELTQQIVGLYGQIPNSTPTEPDSDTLLS